MEKSALRKCASSCILTLIKKKTFSDVYGEMRRLKKITFLHKQASEQKKNFFLRIVILWGKESNEKKKHIVEEREYFELLAVARSWIREI